MKTFKGKTQSGDDKPLVLIKQGDQIFIGTPIEHIVEVNGKPLFIKLKKDKS